MGNKIVVRDRVNRLREYVIDGIGGLRHSNDAVRLGYTGHVYLITQSRDWAGYVERKARIRSLGHIWMLVVL